jgi:hypothetical protein
VSRRHVHTAHRPEPEREATVLSAVQHRRVPTWLRRQSALVIWVPMSMAMVESKHKNVLAVRAKSNTIYDMAITKSEGLEERQLCYATDLLGYLKEACSHMKFGGTSFSCTSVTR